VSATRRVVVTGVGLVSPLGIGTEETWAGLREGRSGAAPITLFDAAHHSTHFACEVKGFDPLRWIEKKDVKKMDRFIQFAVAASDLATRDAGFSVEPATAEVPLYGPPPVSRKMLLKLLKLNANDAIISGPTTISSSGNVTFRKTCHPPPPSTRAASFSSDGIDCKAPIETRKK